MKQPGRRGRESILESSAPEPDKAGLSTSTVTHNTPIDSDAASNNDESEMPTGFDFTLVETFIRSVK